MLAFVSSTTHAHVVGSRGGPPSTPLHLEHRSNDRRMGTLALTSSSTTVSVNDKLRGDRAEEARKRVLQTQQSRADGARGSGIYSTTIL